MTCLAFLAFLSVWHVAKAQVKSDQTSRITIEVSGGENETPVENASIYVKYIEERKILKDKKLELNVKTNRDGDEMLVRASPDAPPAPTADLLAIIDAHLATAAPHAPGTTDRLLAADRDRPY